MSFKWTWGNLKRVFEKQPANKDANPNATGEALYRIYNHDPHPVPHVYSPSAEAVIQLAYSTISIAPNFDIHNPKIVLTVSEIFDVRDRKVNVTRIELTSKEAGRLSRAMSSAADWANGVEER